MTRNPKTHWLRLHLRIALTLSLGALACPAQSGTQPLGLFEGHNDVGTVLHAGAAEFNPSTKTYTVTGSGENMWFATDDFQFVWKKITSKDVSIAADLAFMGEGGNNHRKGVLMIRQSLDTDAAYADAALHGDGLTSLQTRDQKGSVTHEVEASVSAPKRLRLEKRGDWFYLWTGSSDADLAFAGGSMLVALKAPFYIGIGVCAHEKDAVQKVTFSNLEIGEPARSHSLHTYSTLQTIAVASTDSRVSQVSQEELRSPSWNASGQPEPQKSEAGADNQHAAASAPLTSPDGKQLAVLSWGAKLSNKRRIATLSVTNTADHTTKFLIRFMGGPGSLSANPWSPDSKRLAFVSYQELPQ